MTFRVATLPDGDVFFVDGYEVRQVVYDTLRPSRMFPVKTGMTEADALEELNRVKAIAGNAAAHRGPYFQTGIAYAKPLKSNALACHSSQRAEIMARNKRYGLNIQYDRAGRPVFTDSGQRKKLMKIESEVMGKKIVKRNSYNGD